jgi:hypothetical protein
LKNPFAPTRKRSAKRSRTPSLATVSCPLHARSAQFARFPKASNEIGSAVSFLVEFIAFGTRNSRRERLT